MSYGFQPPPYNAAGAPPQGNFAPNAPLQHPPPPYQPSGGRIAYIRQTSSGLCLDATEYEVKLQQHNPNNPAQQWTLEPIAGNKFIIRSRHNGGVLDIRDGPHCGANLITYQCHGGLNQQWFLNADRTITSPAGNLAVDVCEEKLVPGNILIAYNKHGGQNQQFYLEYV